MELIQNGAIFHTTTDSEVIAFHIARERAFKNSRRGSSKDCKKMKGAYGLVSYEPLRKLIAVRDPYGLKSHCVLEKREMLMCWLLRAVLYICKCGIYP